jgi:hypothetical protein
MPQALETNNGDGSWCVLPDGSLQPAFGAAGIGIGQPARQGKAAIGQGADITAGEGLAVRFGGKFRVNRTPLSLNTSNPSASIASAQLSGTIACRIAAVKDLAELPKWAPHPDSLS